MCLMANTVAHFCNIYTQSLHVLYWSHQQQMAPSCKYSGRSFTIFTRYPKDPKRPICRELFPEPCTFPNGVQYTSDDDEFYVKPSNPAGSGSSSILNRALALRNDFIFKSPKHVQRKRQEINIPHATIAELLDSINEIEFSPVVIHELMTTIDNDFMGEALPHPITSSDVVEETPSSSPVS